MQMTSPYRVHIKQISKIIHKYVENSSRLYTGLELKRMWRQRIFRLNGNIENEAIQSGRWSAYAHSTLIASCKNIFNKHQITKSSRVWVHPLTDPTIVDTLISYESYISSFDIQKDTLQWNPHEIKIQLQQAAASGTMPDLLVITSLAGLIEEIIEIISYAKVHHIPVLLIHMEGGLNFGILDTISRLKWGSVVMASYPNELHVQLRHMVSDLQQAHPIIADNPTYISIAQKLSRDSYMYISLFIENRATSILEYHLKESDDVFTPLLSVYEYWIHSKIRNDIGIIKHIIHQVLLYTEGSISLKKLFQLTAVSRIEDVLTIIARVLEVTDVYAIPDIVFEIMLAKDAYNSEQGTSVQHTKSAVKLSDSCVDAQLKARKLHTFFTQHVSVRPKGTLEVPSFYFNRVYLRYFCYSTELQYWTREFGQTGTHIIHSFPIHPLFAQKEHLLNANFASRFLLLI